MASIAGGWHEAHSGHRGARGGGPLGGKKGLAKAARRVGLQPRSLRDIETGRARSTYQRKRAIAALYGCPITDLMRSRQMDVESDRCAQPEPAGGGQGRRLVTQRRAV